MHLRQVHQVDGAAVAKDCNAVLGHAVNGVDVQIHLVALRGFILGAHNHQVTITCKAIDGVAHGGHIHAAEGQAHHAVQVGTHQAHILTIWV